MHSIIAKMMQKKLSKHPVEWLFGISEQLNFRSTTLFKHKIRLISLEVDKQQ
jgi:hypothetical protein